MSSNTIQKKLKRKAQRKQDGETCEEDSDCGSGFCNTDKKCGYEKIKKQ